MTVRDTIFESDADFSALAQEFAPVADDLFASTAVAPPPHLRELVLERVAKTPPNLYIVRDEEEGWFNLGPPGIRVRVLYRDAIKQVTTILMRMDAGSTLPSHPHGGAEECYVIDGDFESFGTMFRTGDYVRAPAGSQHCPSYSRNGC